MDDLQIPEVPGYAIGRLLGTGSSGTVWLGTERRSGRNVAVKCFHPVTERQPVATLDDAVRKEIRILSVLDHPHLVKAHEAVRLPSGPAGEEAGTALIMDYASGGSLGQLLAARGRLGVGETVTVLTPVAQALSYLHGKGFTHSDVSPGNVLLTGQGKPMLSDLGIARMLGEPAGGAGHGTPGFVDPAPVDAVRAGLQPERDVYAVAALGWFCLTGSAPPRTVDRPPLSLLVPEVPKDLAAALEAGLNEDRRLRPGAGALAVAIYRSAAAVPVDLSTAVHPTVVPELLTRRHTPQRASRSKLREGLAGLRRRISTLSVPAWKPVPGTRPPQDTGRKPGVAQRGRHAGGGRLRQGHTLRPAAVARRGPRFRMAIPAFAGVALVLAVVWLAIPWGAAPGTGDEAAAGRDPAPAAQALPEPAATGQGSAAAAEASLRAASPDPSVALRGLAALRDHAFNSGRMDRLDEVNAAGSAAAAADQRTAGRLPGAGKVLSGFTTTLSEVRTEPGATPDRAVVRATAATSAWVEVDASGRVAATGPATAGRTLRLVLVSVDGQWRISEVLPGS
ncbi:protein kinase [Pseudarthrobacter enclensis]|uniref:serine/threonine-protein kinase n=1 Tax=Pseudarthrobacter enclensis TaxID=993070 RepID=UPI003444B32F